MSSWSGDPPMSGCHNEVCVTCSDSAVPMRVSELLGNGLARAGPGNEEISVALVEAKSGDVVLVHAGEAIAVVAEP